MTCRFTEDELVAERAKNNPNGEPVGHFTGRCKACHSADLWEDNLAYGCNHCGALLNTNDGEPLLWPDGQGDPVIPDGSWPNFTVYDRPLDAPDHYVVRLHMIYPGVPAPIATEWHFLCAAIEPIREWMASRGLHCVPRSDGDDPVILETWL